MKIKIGELLPDEVVELLAKVQANREFKEYITEKADMTWSHIYLMLRGGKSTKLNEKKISERGYNVVKLSVDWALEHNENLVKESKEDIIKLKELKKAL